MNATLENKIKNLPQNSGVYIMKNHNGEVIYVGKAKILKNRVSQYFRKNSNHTPKVVHMVTQIEDFEYIITSNEIEALILESNLIKQYRPYYNILMRDDKSYPYIKITLSEKYPRILKTRRITPGKDKYFGPYADTTGVNKAIEAINNIYPIRQCNKDLCYGQEKGTVCLNYHINQCLGVCKGNIPEEEYKIYIDEIIKILSGKTKLITDKLERKMNKSAANLDFERAADYRDKIQGILSLTNRQNASTAKDFDTDIIAVQKENNIGSIYLLEVRNGKISGKENYILKCNTDETENEIILSFIKQFYSNNPFIPSEILLSCKIEDEELICEFLSNLKGHKVTIRNPQKGEKKKLIELAKANAKMELENTIGKEKQKQLKKEQAIKEISEFAKIQKGLRYEIYDISNISGVDNVGAMVVFNEDKPEKKAYRKFKIKNIEGSNDIGSMTEMIFRRISNAIQEKEMNEKNPKFLPLPDIIFTDGGIGHVNAINNLISTFNLNISVIGLVKNSKHQLRATVDKNGNEKSIYEYKYARKILNDMSEEVHRFAIEYHRNLRNKNFLKTELTTLKGIGKVKSQNLLKKFKSLDEMKKASIEELINTDGINEKDAKIVYDFLHGQ